MKLFKVINGYMSDDEVYCLVICNSEEEAITKARKRYKNAYNHSKEGFGKGYPEKYYKNLKAIMMAEDTSKEYIGMLENEIYYNDEEE